MGYIELWLRGDVRTGQENAPVFTRGGSAGIRNLYSYVTSSGDIRYDNRSYAAIVTTKEPCQRADFGTICSKLCLCERAILQDICISGGQESTKPSRPLLLPPSSCENAVKAWSSLKPLKLVRFKRL